MSSLRLFFAIPLSDDLREHLTEIITQLKNTIWGKNIRWMMPENLHITMRFIGACEPDQISPLVQKVAANIKQDKPFTIEFAEVKLFPTPHRPRVIIVTINPCAELFNLAAEVEQGVVAAGFSGENRPFLPHLSIGRMPHHALKVDHLPSCHSKNLTINQIVLMNSKEVAGKRIYEILNTLPFS